MFASDDTISGSDGSKPKSATPNMVIIDLNDDTLGEYDTDEMTTSKSNKNGLKKPIINVCLDMDLSESEVELMNASSNAFFKRAYTRRSEDIFPQNAPFACPYKECNKIFKERIQLYKHYRCEFVKLLFKSISFFDLKQSNFSAVCRVCSVKCDAIFLKNFTFYASLQF